MNSPRIGSSARGSRSGRPIMVALDALGRRGALRLLRSRDNLDDVLTEVPPEKGALLLFRNDPNAWHGYEPFSGPRRVVQLNWVTSNFIVRREQFRHRVSAFFKGRKKA